jgi:hypothetical protein
LVLLSMMPSCFSTAVTPTKYTICDSSWKEGVVLNDCEAR